MKTKTIKTMAIALFGLAVIFSQSCKKTDPPVVDFFADVNDYTVTFTSQATNTNSYSWEFGDGRVSTEANPVHTYDMSGDYNVKLTVSGDGGSATTSHTVTIEPSVLEMLTGGPGAANGKTWKISRTATLGDGAASPVHPSYSPVDPPFPANFLEVLGLGSEYDDKFTFKHDGNYSHDVINGGGITSWVFAIANDLDIVIEAPQDYGVLSAAFSPEANAKFTLTEDDSFTLTATTEDDPENTYNVTFQEVITLDFSGTEFFVMRCFESKVVVTEISSESMNVVVFLAGSYGSNATLPSHTIRLTLEAVL